MAQSTEPPAVSARATPPPAASDENIWIKCPTCKEISFRKEVERWSAIVKAANITVD